ncbi:YkvI family membrane protein [Brevibacillus panacihumi]|uniref:Membrane protein YkvI n=1 Tax=Brevibacillus panacihumi TaxID=497735 RepID=A0A3M8CBX3_9BACL|nr:hypothetical protein [Brevibacillus panacihumi]RNB73220.1 hypothetical protein EDM58_20730 [Brevibacillus panacihumi]
MNSWKKSIQIAATYIGTVVGAGFASGQEIIAFFTLYGHTGTLGILLSTVLFVWLGYKMMWLAHHLQTPSYESFNQRFFGNIAGRAINLFVFLTLFGVTTVMLAGAGSILEEQFQIPYLAGSAGTVLIALLVLRKGLERLMVVNAIVVPAMLLFTLLILIDGGASLPQFTEFPHFEGLLWKSILYISFNLAMAQSVLIPIGYSVRDPVVLLRGAIMGGICLGFMLIVIHTAMLANWQEVRFLDVPILFITDSWNSWLQLFLVLVLFSEIFTTLISNVFGIGQQMRELFQVPENTSYLFLFGTAFVLCLIGYSELLMFLYPLFGYLGLATLLRITWPGRAIRR